MSVISNNILAGASGQAGGAAAGYQIERSLRFNSADSAYLSRTPSSAGNRKTWTWSGWVKKVNPSGGGNNSIFGISTGASTYAVLRFGNGSSEVLGFDGDFGAFDVRTSAVFRDSSAWYHVVLSVDTTQATASNRVRLYVNGVQQSTTGPQPNQNQDILINSANRHDIGSMGSYYNNYFFSGYLADVHFIDGQALAASDFGEPDDNGVWQPIEYAGTYGTNGFNLNFSDNSSAAALGTDQSTNNNNWTVNNISVAAGAGNDSLFDSPTNGTQTDTGLGGQVSGNYATFNPLLGSGTKSNGNLVTTTPNAYSPDITTIAPSSGKWYVEITWDSGSYARIGIQNASVTSGDFGQDTYGWRYESNTGSFYNGSNGTLSSHATYGTGTVVGIALDCDAGKVWISKNGVYANSGDPASGANPAATNVPIGTPIAFACATGTNASVFTLNCGQRAFAYTAPSGFKALNTANLSDPTIADGSTAMDVVTYTGNQSTLALSGVLDFSPDFIWIKERAFASFHALFNTVMGTGGNHVLHSNNTNAASGNSGDLLTFTPDDGFTVNSTWNGATSYLTNRSAGMVAWCWDAGTSTVSNTDGSITSSVRANPSAGFSIVTISSATGSAGATIGHGLGVTPALIIQKARTTTYSWNTYFNNNGTWIYLTLNTTDASSATTTANMGTTPSSTTIGLGSNFSGSNDYVYYCFAPVEGYSAFGSYTGNGSTDGPFVYTGMRSRWVMVRKTSSIGDWEIFDTLRDADNIAHNVLIANDPSAEINLSNRELDILSNGFKIRSTASNVNTSGGTYIYAAFAENPFKYARAR